MNPQQQQQQQQQQPPQKCPRCESMNTKFCYYNNYSLSQPRYYCKACRRYWTQGGTLRNVPVGGGCRKGKRPKTTSSSLSSGDHSRSAPPPPPPPQQQSHRQQLQENLLTSPAPTITSSLGSHQYYHGPGYLSSLAALQSMNPTQQIGSFNQSNLNIGSGVDQFGTSPSNLSLLQGFSTVSSIFGTQQQHQIQPTSSSQFNYQMGNISDRTSIESLYNPSEEMGLVTGRSSSSSANQNDWSQGFMSSSSMTAASDQGSMWVTTGNVNNANATNSTATPPSSLSSSHWPHLQGYGPPPT